MRSILTCLALSMLLPLCRAEEDLGKYLQGRYIYQRQCIYCHGRSGRGNGEWAAGVDNKPRNFRSGVFKFRSTPRGKLPTDADLKRTIRGGISGTMMPAFTKLSESNLEAVITYIKHFSPRWKDPECAGTPVVLPQAPEWMRKSGERAQHAAQGQVLFKQLCTTCHGPEGKGDGSVAAAMRDMWDQPVPPADLSRPHYKSGRASTDVYRSIATGLDGTPMMGYHEVLDDQALWNLVAFLDGLRK